MPDSDGRFRTHPGLRSALVTAIARSALSGALAAALAGCSVVGPSEPSASQWRVEARTAAEDTASAVATARLVLEQVRRERIFARAATVIMLDAEHSADTAVAELEALQPPPGREAEVGRVSEVVSGGADSVRAARVALVAGAGGPELHDVLSRLKDQGQELTRWADLLDRTQHIPVQDR